ncbi:6702_t:CDS:2, partial [Funneliformis caledonium]
STTARSSTDNVKNDQGNLHVDVENDQETPMDIDKVDDFQDNDEYYRTSDDNN